VTVSLQTVVRKQHEGPGSALAGMSYAELVDLVEQMRARDPRIIFDSLRPMGDELWNMIDGERTVEWIAEATCFEFGFDLPPELFLPLFDGLVSSEVVDVVGQPSSQGIQGESDLAKREKGEWLRET
jgi:hypothetical protein